MSDTLLPIGITTVIDVTPGQTDIFPRFAPFIFEFGSGIVTLREVVTEPDRGEATWFTSGSRDLQYRPEGWDTETTSDDATYITSAVVAQENPSGYAEATVYWNVGTDAKAPTMDGSRQVVEGGAPTEGTFSFADANPGDTVSASGIRTTTGGTLEVLDGSGAYRFTPDPGFTGFVEYSFVLSDGTFDLVKHGNFEVLPPTGNTPPAFPDVSFQIPEDFPDPVTFFLIANDLQDTTLAYDLGEIDTKGLAALTEADDFGESAGVIVEVVPDAFGTFEVPITATDSEGASASTTFTVEITPQPDDPVAADDLYFADEGQPLALLVGDLTLNDFDPDAPKDAGGIPTLGTVTFELVSAPAFGTLEEIPGGYIFTPDPLPDGTAERTTFLTYRITDDTGRTSSATVDINVSAFENTDPDITFEGTLPIQLPEDGDITVSLAVFDVDPGQTLTLSAVAGPSHAARFELRQDGTFDYEPTEDYFGPDSFTVRVDDGAGGTDEVEVTLDVTPINDAPLADPDSFEGDEETAITGTLTGSDAENSPLEFFGPPDGRTANGQVSINKDTGAFEYTPDKDFTGTDSFQFIVDDGEIPSDPATIILEVSNVDDVPNPGVETASVKAGGTLRVSLAQTDVDGQSISYSDLEFAPESAGSGTLTFEGGNTLVFTPGDGVTGTVEIVYTFADGPTDYRGTLTVTVENRPPEAFDLVVNIDEDQSANGRVFADDPDGDDLTFVQGPSNLGPFAGTAFVNEEGFFTYTPVENFFGTDVFVFAAFDGELSDIATVTINIAPVNDPPVALTGRADILEGATLDATLSTPLTGDIDGDDLTYAIVVQPVHGTITEFDSSTGDFTYVADPDYVGPDPFTYSVTDPSGETDEDIVTINLANVNDPPTTLPLRFDVPYGQTTTDLQLIATDIDNPDESLVFGNDVFTRGTGQMDENGRFSFTPGLGLIGEATISYTVTDGQAVTEGVAVINVVAEDNLPPVAPPETIQVFEDSQIGDIPLAVQLSKPFDPEGGDLQFTPTVGSDGFISELGWPAAIAIFEDGSVFINTYPNAFGAIELPYTVTDNAGLSATGTLTIEVVNVNDPPVAVNTSGLRVNEGESLTINMEDIAFDIDGDNLNLTSAVPGSLDLGTARITPDLQRVVFEASPRQSFQEPTTVEIFVEFTDTESTPVAGRISVEIKPVNDPPEPGNVIGRAKLGESYFVSYERLADAAVDVDSELSANSIVRGSAQTTDGTVSPDQNGFLFVPEDDTIMDASFTYVIDDGDGASREGTVKLFFGPENVPSKESKYTSFSFGSSTELKVDKYDTADGSRLNYSRNDENQARLGIVEFDEDGTITYTPNPGVTSGTDTFKLNVRDGDETFTKAFEIIIVLPGSASDAFSLGDSQGNTGSETRTNVYLLSRERDVVEFSNDNDFGAAGGGDDVIDLSGGDDQVEGGAGDDDLDGGEGRDEATYQGKLDQFSIQVAPDEIVIEDRTGEEGTDTVRNFEEYLFGDGQWSLGGLFNLSLLDTPLVLELVELYVGYYNRFPDSQGLFFWGHFFEQGFTLEQIAELFSDQDETRDTFADLSTEQVVDTVYDNVLGRDPDKGGEEFWASVLDSGAVSLSQFILEVLRGADAPPPENATPEFLIQRDEDIAYLALKTSVGLYGGLKLGLNDVEALRDAAELFDGTQAGADLSVAELEAAFADAQDPDTGQFLMTLAGLPDDPFAFV